MTSVFFVAICTMSLVSCISTMKVERPRAISSEASGGSQIKAVKSHEMSRTSHPSKHTIEGFEPHRLSRNVGAYLSHLSRSPPLNGSAEKLASNTYNRTERDHPHSRTLSTHVGPSNDLASRAPATHFDGIGDEGI